MVSVDEGDGKSWSAAAVDREVARHAAAVDRYQLTPDRAADGFPQIVELISKRRLIRIAQESGAAPPLPALRRRWIILLAVVLLVLGAASTLVTSLSKAGTGKGFHPVFLIAGALTAALVFLTQEVSARLKRSEREAAEKRLMDAVTSAKDERRGSWDALLEALRVEVHKTTRDRFVVIDDFDHLDDVTREALRPYLIDHLKPSNARELWVVFEDAELAPLTNEVLTERAQARRARRIRLSTVRQLNLDDEARARLAEEVGFPDRSDFRLVKSIVRRDAGSNPYRSLLDGEYASQRDDGQAIKTLELAYLLAVNRITGAWEFSKEALASDLSSGATSAQRSVLRLLLPDATLKKGEVGDAIDRVGDRLGRILDQDRYRVSEIALVREATDLLVQRRGEYHLPPVGLVHLFWALFWYSKLGGKASVDAYRLRKLARHLVGATTPSALGGKVPPSVRDRYFEAAAWTVRELLAASLPDDVATLLVRAEREVNRDDQRNRLRSLTWQAYAVLGSEDVLSVILRLHDGKAGKRSASTSLDRLFVESLRFGDRSTTWRDELAERLPTLGRDVAGYAKVRALWVALTLDRRIPGSWSTIADVATGSAGDSGVLAQDAAARLRNPVQSRVALDALTTSLGLWCVALAFRRGAIDLDEANDVLEEVRLRAFALQDELDEQRNEGAGEDYILRALAHEIEVMAGAAAVVIESSVRAGVASQEQQGRLRDHVKAALPAGGSALSTREAVAQRMALQALTWTALGYSSAKPFGFDQLAAFMTLRRVHLLMLTSTPSESAVNTAMSGLAGQLDEPGMLGLMAWAIAIEGSPSQEISAVLWVRAAELALASGFGKGLETELCLASLAVSHSFELPQLTPIINLLAQNGRDSTRASPLASRLVRLGEADRATAALWLINAAAKPGVSETSRQALLKAVGAMAERTSDESVKDNIRETLDVFQLSDDFENERPVTPTEVLAHWEPRRTSGKHYPWILHLLLSHGHTDGAPYEAAISYLEEHPETPEFTGPIYLAIDIVEHIESILNGHDASSERAQLTTALEYLDRVHPSTEEILHIEANLRIVRLLLRHECGDSESHWARHGQWEAARQERDGLKKLPPLVEAGRFFLVLWHYYETLSFYGLKTAPEVDVSELFSPEALAVVLEEWHARGEPIPVGMVKGPRGNQLSADFLRYGRALFGVAADDVSLEDARESFNQEGLRTLPALFDELSNLRSIPAPVRALLEGHRMRLLPQAIAAR